LENIKTTPRALDAMVTEKAKKLFQDHRIYTHEELEARHEIELEKYIKKVQIESRMVGELAHSHIIPAALRYQSRLTDNIRGLKEAGLNDAAFATQRSMLIKLTEHVNQVNTLVDEMLQARKACNQLSDTRKKAIAYQETVKDPYFDTIRYHVDKLELIVDDREWDLPKYREMLFLR
jgi:glutamine synthetase